MEKLFNSVEEHPEPLKAEVTGIIPDWLEGHLFRAGPGKWDFEDGFTLNHYADGSAILLKLSIEKGNVSVMTKFLDSLAYQKLSQFNKPVFTEFGTRSYPDLCKSIFQRFIDCFLPLSLTDNNFVNFFTLEKELYVISETNYIWKINPEDLTCIEKIDLTNLVPVNSACAHPHKTEDGTLYNMGYSIITGMKYHVLKTPPAGAEGENALERTTIHSTISSSYTTCVSYFHSFGMSENYILFVEQPLLINTLRMATSGIVGYCLKDLLDWYPNEKAIFRVINRETGTEMETKYVSNAFFFLHHINTYEEDGHIVADIQAYEDPKFFDFLFLDNLRSGEYQPTTPGGFTRFVLPLNTVGKEGSNLITLKNTNAIAIKQDENTVLLVPETKGMKGFEMPSINYSMFNSKKYRFVYVTSAFDQGQMANSLVKLDNETGEMKIWREANTMYYSEILYVPRPGSTLEDDGILLGLVGDVRENSRDFFIVLDAKTFKVLAKAFVPISIQMPNTVHGIFKLN